jgi:1-acyl-sn-glycerol-3-phosphate acyltransferase
VKYWVRLGLLFFCRSIIINDKGIFKAEGPMLLACNHPNSFFDAVLLGALFKNPVHFLARGDAFKTPLAKKILNALKAIPIYRLREGKEYLALNDTAFERCSEILQNGGIVLIFSEGLCLNQWHLRPLKKGSARIALNAWKHPAISSAFKVLPVCLNYNSFSAFGKKIIIEFGEPLTKNNLIPDLNEAEQINHFNKLLHSRLQKGILDDDNAIIVQTLLGNPKLFSLVGLNPVAGLQAARGKLTSVTLHEQLDSLIAPKTLSVGLVPYIKDLLICLLLFIPALVAIIIHAPVYYPLKHFIRNKTKGTVFYDSVLFVALLIVYPFYLLLLLMISVVFRSSVFSLVTVFAPLFALTYLVWKESVVGVINRMKLQKKELNILESLAT